MNLTKVVAAPILAACLMLAAYAGAVFAAGADFFSIDTWFKWDGGHYFSIAHTGYQLVDCAGIPGFHPGQWCGNSGWFPGYPYLVRGVHRLTGADTKLVALVVSQAFALLSLLLTWNLFLQRRNVLLLLVAFAPGTYYFLVIFPMSMTVFFMLLALWAMREKEWFMAFLSGAIAGFTYPSGLWLAGPLAGGLLFERWRGRRTSPFAWIAAIGPVMGFGLVLLDHHFSVGAWNAFFLTQEKYKHGIGNPIAVLFDRLFPDVVSSPGWQIALQSLTATAIVWMVVGGTVRAVRRGTERPGDVTLAAHGLTYWLMPLIVGGGLMPYRAETLLLPAAAGLRQVARRWLVLLVAATIAIWMLMATQFVKGRLP